MFCHLRHKERPSTPQHRIVLDHRQDMGVRNVDRLQIVCKLKREKIILSSQQENPNTQSVLLSADQLT